MEHPADHPVAHVDDKFTHRLPVDEVVKSGQLLQLQRRQPEKVRRLHQTLVGQVAVMPLDRVHDVDRLLPGIFRPAMAACNFACNSCGIIAPELYPQASACASRNSKLGTQTSPVNIRQNEINGADDGDQIRQQVALPPSGAGPGRWQSRATGSAAGKPCCRPSLTT